MNIRDIIIDFKKRRKWGLSITLAIIEQTLHYCHNISLTAVCGFLGMI